MLGPEQFGLFAVAFVIVAFTAFFADVGLAYGLIQRKGLTDADVRFVFTWQCVLGLAVAALLFAAAPLVAAAYDDPRLVDVVRWLSPTCLLNAIGATSSALLRRRLDFRSLQFATVGGQLVGFFGVGVPLAWSGAGVHALVLAYLVQATVNAGVAFARTRHPLRPLWWHEDAPSLLRFGGVVLATNVVNWSVVSMDRLVVARAMSIQAAGLYSTAYALIASPTAAVQQVLQGVLYSASAQVQDDRRRVRAGLRTMFGAVALLAPPVFLSIAAVADTVIDALYGAKWTGAGQVLAPLAAAMPAFLLMSMATPALWASGRTTAEARLQVPVVLVWWLALVAVAQLDSLAAFGWCVCLLYHLRAAVIVKAACTAIRLRPASLARALRGAAVATLAVTAAAVLADRGLATLVPGPQLRLLAVVLACALALAIALRLAGALVPPQVRRLVDRVSVRLPAPLRGTLRVVFPERAPQAVGRRSRRAATRR